MLDKEKIGKAISSQRKQKGLTQRHLADMLNVSYQAVSRWELGLSLPSLDMIYDISRILETTVDSLLHGENDGRKFLTYKDSGLDTRKLHVIKKRLYELVTDEETLLHAQYLDPAFFQLDTSRMKEPVYAISSHVPGSKERFAAEYGYDREICMDLVASAANHLMFWGVKPVLLQALITCGNNDSGQLLTMGEAFKEACSENGIVFAGIEVAAQAVNYTPGEYKINAVVLGVTDKKKIPKQANVEEGDVLIGVHSDGIHGSSYPLIKLMLDQRPDILYDKVDQEHSFADALMKPISSYVNVLCELTAQNLIHAVFGVRNSLVKCKSYGMIPEGLGACICLSAIPVPALLRYLYELKITTTESFLHFFSFGIGMMVAVPKESRDQAIAVIQKHYPCHVIGSIERNADHPDEKVWTKGAFQW